MSALLSILFYPKRGKSTPENYAVLYTRITYKGKRAEFSTGRRIILQSWNNKIGKARGISDEARAVNRYLDSIRAALYEIHDRLLREDRTISANMIKEIHLGKQEKQYMLLEIFGDHNDQMEKLIGKGYTKGTLQRYNACKNHIEEFLAFHYRVKDIPVEEVDHKFITGFDHFLRSEKDCAHNTAQKYIVNFKKIIRIAYANQWIGKDPFIHWKGSWKTTDREYLSDKELRQLMEKEFSLPRLELVKDTFLFCCFTGLAYADVKLLSKNNIAVGLDGRKWIKIKRQKTQSLSSIPVLSDAEIIMNKYEDHPYVIAGKGILPVLTNQKSNAYLKEIADLCGISKNLTTHLARHTFATTVTLSNGVSIETVGKMLGHQSLKTTQIYAKVLDKKIGSEMQELENLRIKMAEERKIK